MTTIGEPLSAVAGPPRRSGFFWDGLRRLSHNRLATISGVVIVGVILVAVFADVIAPYGISQQFFATSSGVVDPLASRSTGKYLAPEATHLFGTDQLARDIFSRTVIGLRISLSAAFFSIVVVTAIGIIVGVGAVMGRRFVDDVLMRATDIAFAFPDLLLIILLRAAFGTTLFGMKSIVGLDTNILLLFLAISLTAWPTMARLVRGQLLSIREMEFSTAARAIGAHPLRISTRHWLPNALGPVIVESTFLVPRAIFAEAALSFIGVGVSAPTPSLGVMIDEHFDFMRIQWTGIFFPAGILAVLFLTFQFFGDGLRDALDPRARR